MTDRHAKVGPLRDIRHDLHVLSARAREQYILQFEISRMPNQASQIELTWSDRKHNEHRQLFIVQSPNRAPECPYCSATQILMELTTRLDMDPFELRKAVADFNEAVLRGRSPIYLLQYAKRKWQVHTASSLSPRLSFDCMAHNPK